MWAGGRIYYTLLLPLSTTKIFVEKFTFLLQVSICREDQFENVFLRLCKGRIWQTKVKTLGTLHTKLSYILLASC